MWSSACIHHRHINSAATVFHIYLSMLTECQLLLKAAATSPVLQKFLTHSSKLLETRNGRYSTNSHGITAVVGLYFATEARRAATQILTGGGSPRLLTRLFPSLLRSFVESYRRFAQRFAVRGKDRQTIWILLEIIQLRDSWRPSGAHFRWKVSQFNAWYVSQPHPQQCTMR